jgi:hypothetical protein
VLARRLFFCRDARDGVFGASAMRQVYASAFGSAVMALAGNGRHKASARRRDVLVQRQAGVRVARKRAHVGCRASTAAWP